MPPNLIDNDSMYKILYINIKEDLRQTKCFILNLPIINETKKTSILDEIMCDAMEIES